MNFIDITRISTLTKKCLNLFLLRFWISRISKISVVTNMTSFIPFNFYYLLRLRDIQTLLEDLYQHINQVWWISPWKRRSKSDEHSLACGSNHFMKPSIRSSYPMIHHGLNQSLYYSLNQRDFVIFWIWVEIPMSLSPWVKSGPQTGSNVTFRHMEESEIISHVLME